VKKSDDFGFGGFIFKLVHEAFDIVALPRDGFNNLRQ